MPTTLQIHNIGISPVGQTTVKPTEESLSPINFAIEGLLSEMSTSRTSFKANIRATTKVPGGSGVVETSIEEIQAATGDIVIYRLFRLDAKPKVLQVRVTDHGYGTRTITLMITIPAVRVTTTVGYSDEQQRTMRIFALTNPPVDISQTIGVQIMAEPCPNDGDMLLHFTMNWPLKIQ